MKVENIRPMRFYAVWVYQQGEQTVYEIVAQFSSIYHAQHFDRSLSPVTGVYEIWPAEKFEKSFR